MERPALGVLLAVSTELAVLGQMATLLQSKMSPPGNAAQGFEFCQSLDLLTQTLNCLAAFVSDVGNAFSPDLLVDLDDALEDGCLRDLMRRLVGGQAMIPGEETSRDEFF